MTVCIDTNVVLGMFGRKAPLRALRDAWLTGHFVWAVTSEILLEYEEVVARKMGGAVKEELFRIIEFATRLRKNVRHVSPTFRFQLINADADDNKFPDCAIAAEADFIITEDRHFDAMIGSGYKPQPIKPGEFIRRYLGGD